MENNKSKKINVRRLTACAMLTALSVVLQYLEFPALFMPPFIKFDFSDLPSIIGAYAYGPVAGIIIQLIKNVIHLPMSNSMYVGELSNFILGAIFAGTAGLVYKKKKTKKGALIGGVVGALLMAGLSIATNYFLVYPIYYNFMPQASVLEAYQTILPRVKSIIEALVIFNLPFTFIKGLINVGISMLIYKPLSPFLHKNNRKNG